MSPPTYVMTYRFDAPPERVWRTWTEPDLIKRWYGPGLDTEVHRFEPEPGGLWLHELRMGERSMYQRAEFVEVVPHQRLVLNMGTANAAWEIIDNPFMPDWPRLLVTKVTLSPQGGGTRLTLEWTPYEASEAQSAAFAAAMDSLDEGWGKGMKVIEEILSDLQ